MAGGQSCFCFLGWADCQLVVKCVSQLVVTFCFPAEETVRTLQSCSWAHQVFLWDQDWVRVRGQAPYSGQKILTRWGNLSVMAAWRDPMQTGAHLGNERFWAWNLWLALLGYDLSRCDVSGMDSSKSCPVWFRSPVRLPTGSFIYALPLALCLHDCCPAHLVEFTVRYSTAAKFSSWNIQDPDASL